MSSQAPDPAAPGRRALFRLVSQPDGYRIVETRLVAASDLLQEAARLHVPGGMTIVTDPFAYRGIDQVMPLQPEQRFVLDALRLERLRGARVVEIGAGSGVLSIAALLAGAASVVALEINPRALAFAGFNALVNGVEDRLELRTGDRAEMFAPLAGERFDYLLSNPPFEPTPPGLDYYLNSAAGIYGLDFVVRMLPGLEGVLRPGGHAQIVTMAPGDAQSPTGLLAALATYVPGRAVTLCLDRQPIGYDAFLARFASWLTEDHRALASMREQARRDGVTHLHFCMIHLTAGMPGECRIVSSERLYEDWTTPLGSAAADARLGE